MKHDLGMFKKSTSTSHEPPNTAEHLWLPAEQQQKIAERRGHQQNLVSGDSLLRLRHLGAHLHGLALRGARILVLEASLFSSLVTRLAVTSLLAGLGLHVEDDLPIPAMPSKRKHPYPQTPRLGLSPGLPCNCTNPPSQLDSSEMLTFADLKRCFRGRTRKAATVPAPCQLFRRHQPPVASRSRFVMIRTPTCAYTNWAATRCRGTCLPSNEKHSPANKALVLHRSGIDTDHAPGLYWVCFRLGPKDLQTHTKSNILPSQFFAY